MTEDEMPGGHHQLDGHEFEYVHDQELVMDREASAVCRPWDHKVSDTTEQHHMKYKNKQN